MNKCKSNRIIGKNEILTADIFQEVKAKLRFLKFYDVHTFACMPLMVIRTANKRYTQAPRGTDERS